MNIIKTGLSLLLVSFLWPSTGIAGAHPEVAWSYSGEGGPSHWGELKPGFERCSKGKRQSPVSIITDKTVKGNNQLSFHYTASPIHFIHEHGNMRISYQDGKSSEYITFNGQRYDLINIHMHNPSEHIINGERFPIEAHLVHRSKDEKYAVVAVMLKSGAENEFLHHQFDAIPDKPFKDLVLDKIKINPFELIPKEKAYFTLIGSFTTPPCTEGVNWIIMKKAATASVKQITYFKEHIAHDNNRPIQSINARRVMLNGNN